MTALPEHACEFAARREVASILPLLLTVGLAGLFAAAVLAIGHHLDMAVPCGKSSGCVTIAAHPGSRLFGVPIALFGIITYLVIIGLTIHVPASPWSRSVLLGVTGVGTAVSAGLLLHSQIVIRATCPWCIGSGVAMTVLFALSIALARTKRPIAPVKPAFFWLLVLITSASIGLQAGFMHRAANAPPIPAQRLGNLTREELVDPAKSRGPADAPLTIVVFSDVWCPACRTAYASLIKYQQANPHSVRLTYRHLPLWEIRGHELSGAAAALAEIAGEQGQFWPFVNSIHDQRHLLDREGYLGLLSKLGLEVEAAEERIANPDDPAVRRVWNDVHLAERLGVTSTPTFIVLFGDHPPISANQRTLPRLLNSPTVTARLAAARDTLEAGE